MSDKVAAVGEVNAHSTHSANSTPIMPYGNGKEEAAAYHTYEHVRKAAEEDPRRRTYQIAAIVLTGVALLTTIGSIITAGIMWQLAYDYTGTDTDRVLYASLYIFMLVEGSLSFIALLVYFSVLFHRPNDVLIRDRQNHKFISRCITVFLLLLLSVYSFVVPIVLKDREPKTSPALCVVPAVRFVCLVGFLLVLVADSRI